MKSISETGHVKNVANFEDLISFCTAYQENYNPTKTSITLAALNAQFQLAQSKITKVTKTKNAFDNATGVRQTTFAALKPLATKVINALDATDALPTVIKDAKTINRKLQGGRATTKSKPTDAIPLTEAAGETTTISVSQQSYDRLIDSFDRLIDVVDAEISYNPNEANLKVTFLQTVLADLQTANSMVINKYTDYSNARIDRDKTFYTAIDCLLETAQNVKKYIKSVYGATSPEYKQISGLKFTRLNIK